MPGRQAELFGGVCDWCGLPAVGRVEVVPPLVQKNKDGSTRVIKNAIEAPACDDHINIVVQQPPDNRNALRKKARGVEQLEMFPKGSVPGSALLEG